MVEDGSEGRGENLTPESSPLSPNMKVFSISPPFLDDTRACGTLEEGTALRQEGHMQEVVSRPHPGNCGGTINGETGREGAAWTKSRRLPPDWNAEEGGDGDGNGSKPLPQPHWFPLPQTWMNVPVAPRPVPMAGVRTQKAASSASAQQASNPTLLALSARVRPGREGGLWMGEGAIGPLLQSHALPCPPRCG